MRHAERHTSDKMAMVDLSRALILQRLKAIVVDRIDVNPESLQSNANLRDIGVDSFSMIELVFLAEEEFKIRIPLDEEMPETVAQVLDIIEARLRAA